MKPDNPMRNHDFEPYWTTCPICGERYWSEDPHECPIDEDDDELEGDED